MFLPASGQIGTAGGILGERRPLAISAPIHCVASAGGL